MDAAFAVQDVRPGPGHAFEHHQAQGAAGDVDAVAHGVGAEQAAFLLGAEDVDQGGVVHDIDVLGQQRDAGFLQRGGDLLVHRAQAGDGGEQAEGAAARGHEQGAVGGGQGGDLAGVDVGDDEGAGLGGVVEGRGDGDTDGRAGQVGGADAGLGIGPGGLDIGGAGVAQGGGGDQQALGGAGQGGGEGDGGVEPVAVQADVAVFQAAAVQAQEQDVFRALAGGGGDGADRCEHRLPGGQRVDGAALQRAAGGLDAVAGGFVEFFRFVLEPGGQAFG